MEYFRISFLKTTCVVEMQRKGMYFPLKVFISIKRLFFCLVIPVVLFWFFFQVDNTTQPSGA